LVVIVSALWNLATAVAILIAAIYSYRIYQVFKGGYLSNSYAFAVSALIVAFVTFFVSFMFDLLEFSPTISYGISVKDFGFLVTSVLILASFREAKLFWRQSKDGPGTV
jgi:hypothetical protein